MITTVEVERANGAQFETALALLARFFAEEVFATAPEQIRENLAAMIEDESTFIVLAYDAGAAVGVATVSTDTGVEFGRSAELEDLYVLPAARGRGAARELIRAAQNWCREQNCQTMAIVITPEGEAKHQLSRFYGKLDFRETERKIMFYDLS